MFTLDAWRRVGQPIVNRPLRVWKTAGMDQGSYLVPPFSIVHLKVVLSLDETSAAVVDDEVAVVESEELAAVARQMEQPVIISTERFGDLMLDRSIGWFFGTGRWQGNPVRVTLPTDSSLAIDSGLKTAEALWARVNQWKTKIEKAILSELLQLGVDWQEADEVPLTPERFLSRVTLDSISLEADGRFEFWYDDGMIFGEHSIRVWGSLEAGIQGAGIEG